MAFSVLLVPFDCTKKVRYCTLLIYHLAALVTCYLNSSPCFRSEYLQQSVSLTALKTNRPTDYQQIQQLRQIKPPLFPSTSLESLSAITMKFFTTLLPLFLSSLATSSSFSFFANDQQVLDDGLNVPGDNPLTFYANPDDFILTINNVDLDPNPPSP